MGNKINSGTNTIDIINGFLSSRKRSALQRITEFYQKFLGRQPDSGGLDFWTNMIQNSIALQDIIKGFVTSDEYQRRSLATPSIVISVQPSLISIGIPTQVTVFAHDSKSINTSVNGVVFINGSQVGSTNIPFKFTFTSSDITVL